MKKTILFLGVILFFSVSGFVEADCFLVKENDKVIINEGDCKSRHAPRCSFNIAISLMGFNEGILIDQTHPEFPFKKGYHDYVEKWKQPHNPSLWMKNSCLWYSQVLTKKLGMGKFKEYITKFNYGSQDVSGDKGKNNGLTRSWMTGSSLNISPEEQTIFLQKFLDHNLKVNHQTYEMTKNIIFLDDLIDGWKLYGKTGTGYLPIKNIDGTPNTDCEDCENGCGWFVGWIEKDKRAIVFASYVEQNMPRGIPAGGQAKRIVIEKLIKIIQVKS
jgi:beta-lactamase class D